jgi:hypothetical protein
MIDAADAAGAARAGGRGATTELRAMEGPAGVLAKSGKADTRPAIAARTQEFLGQNQSMSNAAANRMVRELDNITDRAYSAARKGGPPVGLETEMDAALGSGLRRQVRTNVPGIEAVKQSTSDLAGLERALQKAATRKHLLTRMMGISTGIAGAGSGALATGGDPTASLGGGLGAAGAAYVLTNPRSLGRMALLARNSSKAAEMTPQMARILALIASLEAPEPSAETLR